MWSVWVEAKLCRVFFYHLFIHVLLLEIQLLRGEGWDPINQFNPAIFLCLSQAKTCISNVICHGIFCVQWAKLTGDWSLLILVELMTWLSLFKLSFHNSVYFHPNEDIFGSFEPKRIKYSVYLSKTFFLVHRWSCTHCVQ